MATILLAGLGGAIGGAVLPAGITVLGQTITGAALGQAVGGAIGRAIDVSLLTPGQTVEGPRLENLDVQISREGAPLPVVEGRARVAGQVIWATRLEEVVTTTTQGGKGSQPKTTTTEYSYFANFAVALTDCTTGPLRRVGRVWADGELLDTTALDMRVYLGTEDQAPDAFMVAKDGAAPAYRGVSYVVFERMPLADYGNRIPNLTFEVFGPAGDVEDMLRGVDLIPGATEWGYSPAVISKDDGEGATVPENAARFDSLSDWRESIDHMQAVLPAVQTVALVVAWWGDDLRCAHCTVAPRVETAGKATAPRAWQVAGLDRAAARVVSMDPDGRPAYGSTPDDQSVIDAIADLKARGLRVVLYPFIMMDIPEGNTLPDRDGGTGQPAFPWRGRLGPAAADGPVASQVAAFVGTATPADFPAGSGVPTYTGPDEWTYRRFILHLAALARAAGGVDAFLIGSEMVDMTTATDTPGEYPFVDSLVALAADVKSMLPSAAVSYAADWSEYHSHRNGGEVFFHLDSLWASANVDFIGIDNYLPISDWRPGTDHADYNPAAGHTSPYSLAYMKANIEGGEYFDWYYATEADRDAQVRTPIVDSAYGEPWAFRQKDLRGWWSNAHHNRPGGVRDATPTAFVPASKPVWFTEFGCPAVDLGANEPNKFIDPKSAESALPRYSSGARDDFMQRQYLRAWLEWAAESGGSMVQPADMLAWCWDARPWPEFPRSDSWSDGENWRLGHWLNGRAGAAPAAEVLRRRLLTHYGLTAADLDLTAAYGQADGVLLPGPMSARDLLATWQRAVMLDASERDGRVVLAARAAAPLALTVSDDVLVDVSEGAGAGGLFAIERAAADEKPRTAVIRYIDGDLDYQPGAARAALRAQPGEADAAAEVVVVSDLDRMRAAAERMLRAAADAMETLTLTLPPSLMVQPGDVLAFTPPGGREMRWLVTRVSEGAARQVSAVLHTLAPAAPSPAPPRARPVEVVRASTSVALVLMDLPALPLLPDLPDYAGLVAMHARPWPGGADLYRSTDESTGYALNLRAGLSATIGETVSDLPPGRASVWSGERLDVRLYSGALVSRPESDVLAGANALAIEHAPGAWEVVQFRDAELIDASTWRLSRLLRGKLGTEWVRGAAPLPAGARVVVLDSAIAPAAMIAADVGRPYWWKALPAGGDPASAVAVEHAFSGAGRRPYAPAHLRASLSGATLSLTWARRSRAIEADEWPASGDVPLAETAEVYRVEIGPAAAPLLVADVTTPAASLDVSALAGSGVQEVRVAQVSETYGPGPAATAQVTL